MVRTALRALAFFILSASCFAAVAGNSTGTAFIETGSTVTTIDLTTVTVSAGSNQCLIAALWTANETVSSVTITWDQGGTNQAMTLKTGDNGDTNIGSVYIFKLIAPTQGNKTMRASWTGNSAGASLYGRNYSGADQSTCTDGAHDDFVKNTNDPQSLAVTSSTDGATFAFIGTNSTSITAVSTQTTVGLATTTAASEGFGNASNTHTFDKNAANSSEIISVHILAAAGVTRPACAVGGGIGGC